MTPRPAVAPGRWNPPTPAPSHPSPMTGLRVLDAGGPGAEDVVLLDDGRVVTGLADGRVVALRPDGSGREVLADTGGRPLGIERHPDGLVVCDARRELLLLRAPSYAVEELLTEVDGVPLVLCNNAAVAPDGTIYLTDSSTKFGLDHWRGELIEHVPTGRLLRRDPDGTVTVLLGDLAFANGVALAPDASYVVVAQTGAYSLRRLWLTGPYAGRHEPFGPTLDGFPDNISTGDDGLVWVAVASPRDPVLDRLFPRAPFLRRAVWALPQALQPNPRRTVRVQAFDGDGRLVHDLAGEADGYHMVTGVRRVGDQVWMGSLEEPAVAVCDAPG